jgi:hypothetical protein
MHVLFLGFDRRFLPVQPRPALRTCAVVNLGAYTRDGSGSSSNCVSRETWS